MSIITDALLIARQQLEEAFRAGDYPSSPRTVDLIDRSIIEMGNDKFPVLSLYDAGEERLVVRTDADGNMMFQSIWYCRIVAKSPHYEQAIEKLGAIDPTVKRYLLSSPTLSDNQIDLTYLESQDRGIVNMAEAFFAMVIHRVRFLYVATVETA